MRAVLADAGRVPAHRSIRTKLLLLVAGALVLAMTIATALALYREADRYAQAKRETMLATAQALATTVAAAAASRDEVEALASLRAIARLPGVVHARLVDSEGRGIAAIGVTARLASDLAFNETSGPLPVLALVGSRSVEVSVPVIQASLSLGRLSLVMTTDDLAERLNETLLATLAGAAAALALALVIAHRLQRGITGPLLQLTQTIARIRGNHDFGARMQGRAGDEVGVLVDNFNAMLDEICERDAALAAHRDRLEDEVRQRTADYFAAMRSAEEANAAKSTFLATMSHEIRTPMNGVLVMADLLARAELPPAQRRQAEVIARSGQALLAILNDILDLSKIEAGKLELERAPVDLAQVASDVVNLFAERARSKGLELVAWVAPDLPATVAGDAVRLSQVLTNLVNNALKFTEKGFVRVAIERDAGNPAAIRFAVTDTGIGIPADKVETIFAAFSQADATTTRRFGGTGLGLAIAQRLINAMGGVIAVESKVGEGSTFSFALSLAETGRQPWPRIAGESRPLARVLVGSETGRAVARYLEATGYAMSLGEVDRPAAAEPALVAGDVAALASLGETVPRATTVLCLAPSEDRAAAAYVAARPRHHLLPVPVTPVEVRAVLETALAEPRQAGTHPAAPRPAADLPRFHGVLVLVADDSAVNREIAAAALDKLGARALCVEDGAAAVAAAADPAIALVLMDGSMPGMDGFEACRAIRRREAEEGRPRLPVVALTAHVVGTRAEAWREAGMDAVLHKPFTLEALARCLAQFCTPDAGAEATGASPPQPTSALPAPRADLPLLDENALDALRSSGADGEDLVSRVVGLYREHAPVKLADLERALGADPSEGAAAAHALKSMSTSLGAVRVARAAAAVEHALRLDERQPTTAEMAALRAAVSATLTELDDPKRPPRTERPSAPAPRDHEAASLEDDLREAVGEGSLTLVYQPLVDRQGRVAGAEALLRWPRQDGSTVSPAVFIPIAEATGLINTIGAWVLRRACADAAAWPGAFVAVNVSAVQLQEGGFARDVEEVLRTTGLPPERLELEITETALMAEERAAIALMERLRRRGVRFALDDFGTGYSSLTHLRRLPVDTIKIDRSFVAGLDQGLEAATIIHAVASIGRALGRKLVAEGIETEAQQAFVAAAGVHLMQGYLFGRPMAVSELRTQLGADARAAAA